LLHTLALTTSNKTTSPLVATLLAKYRHASAALLETAGAFLRALEQRDKLVVFALPDVSVTVTQSIAFLIFCRPLCLYARSVERSTGDENLPHGSTDALAIVCRGGYFH
jgi:hypothetical protein